MRVSFVLFTLVFTPLPLFAQDSGFLTDYSQLESRPEYGGDRIYVAPGAPDLMGQYTAFMLDQPVLIVAEDSDYKGIKPDDAKAIADGMRGALAQGLKFQPLPGSGEHLEQVETPGENVLLIRVAATHLYVRKNKRGLLGYTPIGAVAKGVKDAASDVIDKTTLVEMRFEVELVDTATGDVLAASILDAGQRRDKKADVDEDAVSWEGASGAFFGLGRRLTCRIGNVALASDTREDCLEIPLEWIEGVQPEA